MNGLPSVLEYRHTPSEDYPNARESSRAKHIPTKVGARTYTLRIGKAFDDDPSYGIVSCMSSWNEVIVRHCVMHVFVERGNHTQQLWGTSNLLEECEDSFSADLVKGLCRINKGDV